MISVPVIRFRFQLSMEGEAGASMIGHCANIKWRIVQNCPTNSNCPLILIRIQQISATLEYLHPQNNKEEVYIRHWELQERPWTWLRGDDFHQAEIFATVAKITKELITAIEYGLSIVGPTCTSTYIRMCSRHSMQHAISTKYLAKVECYSACPCIQLQVPHRMGVTRSTNANFTQFCSPQDMHLLSILNPVPVRRSCNSPTERKLIFATGTSYEYEYWFIQTDFARQSACRSTSLSNPFILPTHRHQLGSLDSMERRNTLEYIGNILTCKFEAAEGLTCTKYEVKRWGFKAARYSYYINPVSMCKPVRNGPAKYVLSPN